MTVFKMLSEMLGFPPTCCLLFAIRKQTHIILSASRLGPHGSKHPCQLSQVQQECNAILTAKYTQSWGKGIERIGGCLAIQQVSPSLKPRQQWCWWYPLEPLHLCTGRTLSKLRLAQYQQNLPVQQKVGNIRVTAISWVKWQKWSSRVQATTVPPSTLQEWFLQEN